jgi:ferritin-like metal-binding protein YciE
MTFAPAEAQTRKPSMKTLRDLFMHTLQDIYYAESQILEALPKMIEKAETTELRNVLNAHLSETEKQIERLEEVFSMADEKPSTEQCEAIDGLIDEAEEIMGELEDDRTVLDAGIIAAGQAVEHYEIARYGTLIAWADQIGLQQAKGLLEQTLEEEKRADKLLTEVAMQNVNRQAAE